MESDNLMYVRHLQYLFHVSRSARHSQLSSRFLQLAGDIQTELFAFKRVRASNEEERPVEADVEAAQPHLPT